jgi:drug/metabolite transporter (DMT)-like permease
VTGAVWAAASGIGFGLFQSVNRRAVRDIDNTYVSTFLQLAVATLVLVAASLATQDLGLLADAAPWSLAAFAAAGVVHFLLGWTFLNISQKRIGAARTAPLLTLTPLFGLLIAVVTLGELPKAAALAAIAPMMLGAWLLSSGGATEGVRPADAVFGIGCALMWAISPVLTVRGLEGLDSPLLGVTLGMLAAVAAFGVTLAGQGTRLGLGTVAREALAVKLLAGLLVAVATWWRWLAVADETVGVVLALSLLSVPVVLFLAPLLVGRHVEQVTLRVWAGSALVVGGALVLVLVRG